MTSSLFLIALVLTFFSDCNAATTTAGSAAVATASPATTTGTTASTADSSATTTAATETATTAGSTTVATASPATTSGTTASTADSPATTTAATGAGNTICPDNSGMPDNVRQTMLDLHNSYRSSVARGLEPDALGGNAPKASKMLKMKYDCSVEASAIKHANKCVFEHSEDSERPDLGENLFASSDPALAKATAATQAAQGWWEELKVNGVGPSNNLTDALWDRPDKQIGHYTQMAWDTSYRLGCAVINCQNFTYAVCQYGPSGNIINSLIYTIGDSCTGCPTTNTCSTTEGLCNVP